MKNTMMGFAALVALGLVAACGENADRTKELPIYGRWTAPELDEKNGDFTAKAVVTIEKGLTRIQKTCTVGKDEVTVEAKAKSEITADRWKVLEDAHDEKKIGKFLCEANIEKGEVTYKIAGDKLTGKDVKRNVEQTMTRLR